MALPELRTNRLRWRAWRETDLAPFAALNADLHVMEPFPAPLVRGESDASAVRIRAHLYALTGCRERLGSLPRHPKDNKSCANEKAEQVP